MNLKAVVSCTLITLFCTVAARGAGPVAVITNKTGQVLTNQTKNGVTNPVPALVLTNQIVVTNQIVEATTTNTGPVFPDKDYTNSVEMEFVRLGPRIWAGKYEVTQKEFQKVMGANPSQFGGGNRPVDSVNYLQAVDFCKKMTEKELREESLPKGFSYVLPTEGQWEMLVSDASLADAVTSANGSRSGTSPVGSLRPNSLGLYDTRGNVNEFCLADPSKPYRVLRGGSWQDSYEVNLRTIFRTYVLPDKAENTYGFRCLLVFDGELPKPGQNNQQ